MRWRQTPPSEVRSWPNTADHLGKLEARFFSNRTDQKALGQAMGTLRKQLVKSGLDKKMVALLIRPVRGVGYALGMPATEIAIEP
jgi:hypothetical protein